MNVIIAKGNTFDDERVNVGKLAAVHFTPVHWHEKKAFTHDLVRDDFMKIYEAPGFKSQMTWTLREMKRLKLTTASSHLKPACEKFVLSNVLNKGTPGLLSREIFGREEAGLNDMIFGIQVWAQSDKHANVGCLPFGIPDVRLLLKGSYTVVGVPFDECPGATLQDKILGPLHAQGAVAFVEAAESHGFVVTLDEPGTLVCLPPDHIIATVGSQEGEDGGAEGIRWGFWSDRTTKEEALRHEGTIQQLMKIYPDLKEVGYEAWAQAITKYMLRAAIES